MPLSVIGSGFGRTGTMSLKLALEQLGFGPCHHMEEVMDHPEQVSGWISAAKGDAVNWDEIYDGYGSTVDWPGAHYWRQLAETYPDAKVIHSTRPAEKWWASYSKTIGMVMSERANGDADSEMETIPDMAFEIVAKQTFDGAFNEELAVRNAFEKRARDVVSSISADRLLVFDVTEGWPPLCEFLGVPVPEGPFPRSNNQDDFWEMVKKIGSKPE